MMGKIISDYEEFKDDCYWWPEVDRYMYSTLQQGWTFCSAFDLDGRGLRYLVTFRHYEPPEKKDVYFDYRSGTIRIS